MLSQKEIEFIVQNAAADTDKLLFGASKYQGINVKLCVNCIEARKKLAAKLPLWHQNPNLVYPFPLSAEQCSSQKTAEYKEEIIAELLNYSQHNRFLSCKPATNKKIIAADLTGGMGVDTFYLSRLADKFYYFERSEELCKATKYNFEQLGVTNIQFYNCEINPQNIAGTFENILQQSSKSAIESENLKPLNFIFIDPARRSKTDKAAKVISLKDYEPNLLEIKEELFKLTNYILVKVSPMADIKLNLELLPETVAIHVVSVDNECKELLFLLKAPALHTSERDNANASTKSQQDIPITTVSINSKLLSLKEANGERQQSQSRQKYCFTFTEEEDAKASYTSTPQQYLYEPNKSILKAGAFKSISSRYKVEKLAPSTHLYTSYSIIADFPGKIFKIEAVIDFNKKAIKNLAKEYPHADLSARNFPLNTNELKKLSGIKDGGNHHIFAVTLTDGSRKLLVTCVQQVR